MQESRRASSRRWHDKKRGNALTESTLAGLLRSTLLPKATVHVVGFKVSVYIGQHDVSTRSMLGAGHTRLSVVEEMLPPRWVIPKLIDWK